MCSAASRKTGFGLGSRILSKKNIYFFSPNDVQETHWLFAWWSFVVEAVPAAISSTAVGKLQAGVEETGKTTREEISAEMRGVLLLVGALLAVAPLFCVPGPSMVAMGDDGRGCKYQF